jgi:hypothetical protein
MNRGPGDPRLILIECISADRELLKQTVALPRKMCDGQFKTPELISGSVLVYDQMMGSFDTPKPN